MKTILLKDDVAKAINALTATNTKPTLKALHAALGHRGSMSTLVKLKAEIEAEAAGPLFSEDAMQSFRNVWSAAVAEGRQQKETEIAALKEAQEALMSELQTMEGQAVASNARVAELEKLQSELTGEVTKAAEEVTRARATGETHALKLAEALERIEKLQTSHATEITRLREQLDKANAIAHELELKLARAEAKLDAFGAENASAHPSTRA